MHTSELEEVCMQQGLPVFRAEESGSFEVLATGSYPTASHWVKVSLTQNERVGVLLEFPPCQVEKIERLDELCGAMNALLFGDEVTIDFDESGRYFYVYGVTPKERLGSYLSELARSCDFVKPLCESIGVRGTWTPEVFDMAHTPAVKNRKQLQ